ncbi:Arsenical pump-driving ATPase [Escherichia coli]|nr:Arsenical pump-driving ATPase [Escherichia coli]
MSLSVLVDDIARSEHGLIMLMGKGGVGKTTMAAAIAVSLADKGFDVHLTTSDPAAHLSTTLNGSLKNLQVSRINPHDETERYRQHVLETKGRDLDEGWETAARRGFTFSLHRRDCGVPGVFTRNS